MGPPLMTLDNYKSLLTTEVLPKLYKSQNSAKAISAVKDLGCPQYRDVFLYEAIKNSLSEPIATQQWISEVITLLFDAAVINTSTAIRAFEKLILSVDQLLELNNESHWRLLAFLDCATQDRVLPSTYLHRLPKSYLEGLLEKPESEQAQKEVEAHLEKLTGYRACLQKHFETPHSLPDNFSDLHACKQECPTYDFGHEAIIWSMESAMHQSQEYCHALSQCFSDEFDIKSPKDRFTSTDFDISFIRLFNSIEELKLKTANASNALARFAARAVADEILQQSFFNDIIRLEFGGKSGAHVALVAKKWMVDAQNATSVLMLYDIWTDPKYDVEEEFCFKSEVRRILSDHCGDQDITATSVALAALHMTPDLCVELVRRTLCFALEASQAHRKALMKLLNALVDTSIIQLSDIFTAFQICQQDLLEEILIDHPNARPELEQLKTMVEGI